MGDAAWLEQNSGRPLWFAYNPDAKASETALGKNTNYVFTACFDVNWQMFCWK